MNVIIFLLNAKAFNIGLLITIMFITLHILIFDSLEQQEPPHTYLCSVQCSIKNCNKKNALCLQIHNNNHMVNVKS